MHLATRVVHGSQPSDPLTGAFRRYADLLKQRKILGHAGAGAFFYSGIYAYIAGTPSAFITHHRVPAEYYGLLFGAGIIGIVITNLINARLVHRFGIGRILSAGTLVAMIAGIAVAVSAYADLGGLWGLFAPLLIFVSATGFIVANSIAGAMADEPGQAGSVSALVGAILAWGFAPWTGGPLSLIDTVGPARFVAECEELARRFGKRFEPNRLLRDLAASGDTFYRRFAPQSAKAA